MNNRWSKTRGLSILRQIECKLCKEKRRRSKCEMDHSFMIYLFSTLDFIASFWKKSFCQFFFFWNVFCKEQNIFGLLGGKIRNLLSLKSLVHKLKWYIVLQQLQTKPHYFLACVLFPFSLRETIIKRKDIFKTWSPLVIWQAI